MRHNPFTLSLLGLALAHCIPLGCSATVDGSAASNDAPRESLASPAELLPAGAVTAADVAMVGNALGATRGQAPLEDAQAVVGEDATLLFLPESNSGRTVVNMCWQPSAYAQGELEALYTEGRAQIEAAIENSWVAHSWVRVTWAADCSRGGIPVEIEDRRSSADRRGVLLNFTFSNYIPLCAPTDGTASNPTWTYCVRSLAVHEFGHVLGFDHEQNKTPDGITCQDGTTRPHDVGNFLIKGNLPVGPVDSGSVMSYCNEGFTDKLASGDIESVGALYGATGRHIEHGQRYALRLGRKFGLAEEGATETLLGHSNLIESTFTVERIDGEGNLQLGDHVRLTYGDQTLCAIVDNASGDNASGEAHAAFTREPLEPAACTWNVTRHPDVIGDKTLDVNDPLTLSLDPNTALGTTLPSKLDIDTRLLGPF